MEEAHDVAVASIAAQVKVFHEKQMPFRIYHGATNSTRRSQRRADNTIDTSQLKRILSIDVARRSALVEPNVAMDTLVRATLPHRLVPPVVMELPGITVGGGFSGTSGESSSFRYGAFDATIRSVEVVLADGRIEKASRTRQQDLLWGAASAFGTLGVVTLLEVELRPACRYVQLTYSLAVSAGDAVRQMREACGEEENDYVDAIVFSMDETVVCVGRLSDEPHEPGVKPLRFTRRHDPWFYVRARKVLGRLGKSGERAVVDTIPLEDYLFRYDRGGFWVGRYAFRYFLTPFNRVTRFALDRYMHARVMYRALHKSGLGDAYLVQDVGIPYDRVEEFQAWLDTSFGIYPLWLCPLRVRRDEPGSNHGLHSDFARPDAADLMNFGVWGPVRGNRREYVRQNRALEQKVQALGGKKWLYAHAYYTEDEFWAHYDKASYDGLRAKYGAGYLPSVYDKVKVDVEAEEAAIGATWKSRAKARIGAIWPLRGLYGFASAVAGSEYLLQKKQKKSSKQAQKEGMTKGTEMEVEAEKESERETEKMEKETEEEAAETTKAMENKSQTETQKDTETNERQKGHPETKANKANDPAGAEEA
ncbi:FAD binding domain protein [Drechmeria coniospora]|uniref:Delta(24)-sterol reductase n=1 Tax=Drechmeria coniospora TaxID=98403 RepID=A0A151GLX0_DRECN|nr:FAD binding domain protein [Drechmeria coniospora]KYK58100.1 FAD binding domain protein [Drechmeria coniospora]